MELILCILGATSEEGIIDQLSHFWKVADTKKIATAILSAKEQIVSDPNDSEFTIQELIKKCESQIRNCLS